MKYLNKKGQEEMVGFVLIVVIVAVIFLVFLGIALRQAGNTPARESVDITQFLESTMRYTTGCAINYVPAYATIGDLIKKCYENGESSCVSGENVCSDLKDELNGLIGASWNIGSESANKGYEFKVVYDNNVTKQDIVLISGGNCSADFTSSESILPEYPGTIISSFKLCT